MTSRFWVVMGPSGLAQSPRRHTNETVAFREAERLARMYGGTFFVLEAKGAAARVEVQIEKFGDRDLIPF